MSYEAEKLHALKMRLNGQVPSIFTRAELESMLFGVAAELIGGGV